ncbi:hypothetical protein AAH057_18135, partial [Parabacteroides merdae]
MKKGLYALSFGTFGLGIAEFIMMSILPDVAAGFDISLSEAGHLISAYALGVCVGAPLVVVVARSWPLRTILLALVGLVSRTRSDGAQLCGGFPVDRGCHI